MVHPSTGPISVNQGRGLELAIAGVVATVLLAAVAGSWTPALVTLGGLAGLVAVAALALALPGRLSALLLLLVAALLTVPVDKYFAYRPHVGGWSGFRVAVSDLPLVLLAILALLGARLGRGAGGVPRPVLIVYALLLVQYAVSLVGAHQIEYGWFEMASAVHALTLAVVVAAIFRPALLGPLTGLVGLEVLVHTSFAAAQIWTGQPVGIGFFGGGSPTREALESGAIRLRPSGLFDHPIVFANFLMMSIPLLLAATLAARTWTARLAALAVLAVGASGLLMTLSRGAWISTAVAVCSLLALASRHRLLSARRWRAIGAVALVMALLGTAFAPRVYERLVESQAGAVDVRYELNEIALRMIADRPLVGVGLSNFIPVMDRYDPKDVMSYFPATVHNLYLLEAAEAGLPALVLFAGLLSVVLLIAARRLPLARDDFSRWVAAALVAGLAGFAVSQLADFSHRIEPLKSLVWFNVGWLFGILRQPPPRAGAPEAA